MTNTTNEITLFSNSELIEFITLIQRLNEDEKKKLYYMTIGAMMVEEKK